MTNRGSPQREAQKPSAFLSSVDHSSNAFRFYDFDRFRLDTRRRLLLRDGEPVAIKAKALDTLEVLVRGAGRLLEKEELMSQLWPDTAVEDGNLTQNIFEVRRALGEVPGEQRFIATIARRGYRFVAEVSAIEDEASVRNDQADGEPPDATRVEPERLSRTVPVLALLGLAIATGASGWIWRTSHRADAPGSPYGTRAVPLTSYPAWEASPSLSPDGTQVAFAWDGRDPGNYDIYVKLVGEGEPMRVTNDPRREAMPAWSPDGRRLAFIRATNDGTPWHLVVVPALGGTDRLVASLVPFWFQPDNQGTTLLSWTPDSKWVAIGAIIDGEYGIWLVEVDGPRRLKLTQPPPRFYDRSPAVSSDGTRVAFIRVEALSGAGLHILPLRHDFSPAGPAREVLNPWPRYVGSIAWGADQASLLFSVAGHLGMSRLERLRLASDRLSPAGIPEPLPFGDQATGLTVNASGRLVYVRRLRDTGFWALDLQNPSRGVTAFSAVASSLDEHSPHISPDGRRLVFASTRSGTEEIWIANVDGSNPRQMTAVGGPQCSNPQWSPDGRLVAFESASAGSPDLYLLEPATAGIRRLTTHPGVEQQPRWSRDGQWIYFAAGEIWRISRDGGEAVQVTRGGVGWAGAAMAEESYDGRWLYVTRRRPRMGIFALSRVPLDGGEEVQLANDLASANGVVVGRRTVYFMNSDVNRVAPTSIIALDIVTGHRTTLAPVGKRPWFGMTLSPDERWLLLSAINDENLDLMVVDPP